MTYAAPNQPRGKMLRIDRLSIREQIGDVEKNKSHRGFTLAEVLVTLAIIAIMAAVLLPALNQQIAKGDTGRLASDLTNIQTAAQAFLSDVHRYPSTLAQLTTAVTGNDINQAAIPAALQLKWKGPYISRDVVSNTGGGGTIASSFSIVTSNSIPYLTVTVSPIASADFSNIEQVLDEGTTSSTSSTAGNIRWTSTGSTLTFLALPIQ
jgi:prepilin-type N-terminal cleavage/methylation domain-containing protein